MNFHTFSFPFCHTISNPISTFPFFSMRFNYTLTNELEETIPDETFQKTSEGELTMYIQDYLRSLPSDKRILFVRRYWYGDSIKEFELLDYFMSNQGIAHTRERILDSVWSYDYFGDARTIDTHVKKLRRRWALKATI